MFDELKEEVVEYVWPDEYVCVDVFDTVGDGGTSGATGGVGYSQPSFI